LILQRILYLVCIVLLSACVSVPKASQEDQAAAKLFAVVPSKAQLYIVRPSSYAMAVLYQVSVDGRIVGSLAAKTFLVQTLAPGSHSVSFFNSTSQESMTLEVGPDKIYYLRVGANPGSMSNRARFKLVTDEEGRELVRANTMVVSTPVQ
jgi:Protein of unknown function (DUF2846)